VRRRSGRSGIKNNAPPPQPICLGWGRCRTLPNAKTGCTRGNCREVRRLYFRTGLRHRNRAKQMRKLKHPDHFALSDRYRGMGSGRLVLLVLGCALQPSAGGLQSSLGPLGMRARSIVPSLGRAAHVLPGLAKMRFLSRALTCPYAEAPRRLRHGPLAHRWRSVGVIFRNERSYGIQFLEIQTAQFVV
jgi:hypothetical protein